MRAALRVAIVVLAVLGGLAIIQTLAGAGNRPQIVYVSAPSPTPAPAPQQVVIRHEVVRVEQSPAPEPVQYEAPEPVQYAPSMPVEYAPPESRVYSAPMAPPPVFIQRESHQTRNVIIATGIGVVVGAALAHRRGAYGNSRYGWGGGRQFGSRGGRRR